MEVDLSKDEFSILLVDDEDDIVEMLSDAILSWFPRADLDCVSNGRAAFESIKAKRYHFMITDFKMPVMDGGTLLRSLKNLDQREIPKNILVLSGYLEPGEPGGEFSNVSFMDKMEFANKLKNYLESKSKIIDNEQEGGELDASTRVVPWRDEPVRIDISREDLIEIRFVKNISVKGLGIGVSKGTSIFSQGGQVDLVITLPQMCTIRAKGKIVHTGSLYSQSMGIEFIELGNHEKGVISDYIRRIALNENR